MKNFEDLVKVVKEECHTNPASAKRYFIRHFSEIRELGEANKQIKILEELLKDEEDLLVTSYIRTMLYLLTEDECYLDKIFIDPPLVLLDFEINTHSCNNVLRAHGIYVAGWEKKEQRIRGLDLLLTELRSAKKGDDIKVFYALIGYFSEIMMSPIMIKAEITKLKELCLQETNIDILPYIKIAQFFLSGDEKVLSDIKFEPPLLLTIKNIDDFSSWNEPLKKHGIYCEDSAMLYYENLRIIGPIKEERLNHLLAILVMYHATSEETCLEHLEGYLEAINKVGPTEIAEEVKKLKEALTNQSETKICEYLKIILYVVTNDEKYMSYIHFNPQISLIDQKKDLLNYNITLKKHGILYNEGDMYYNFKKKHELDEKCKNGEINVEDIITIIQSDSLRRYGIKYIERYLDNNMDKTKDSQKLIEVLDVETIPIATSYFKVLIYLLTDDENYLSGVVFNPPISLVEKTDEASILCDQTLMRHGVYYYEVKRLKNFEAFDILKDYKLMVNSLEYITVVIHLYGEKKPELCIKYIERYLFDDITVTCRKFEIQKIKDAISKEQNSIVLKYLKTILFIFTNDQTVLADVISEPKLIFFDSKPQNYHVCNKFLKRNNIFYYDINMYSNLEKRLMLEDGKKYEVSGFLPMLEAIKFYGYVDQKICHNFIKWYLEGDMVKYQKNTQINNIKQQLIKEEDKLVVSYLEKILIILTTENEKLKESILKELY